MICLIRGRRNCRSAQAASSMAGNDNDDDAIGVDDEATTRDSGRRSTAGSTSSAQANAASSGSSHLKAMQAKARRRSVRHDAHRARTRKIIRCVRVVTRDEGQGPYFFLCSAVLHNKHNDSRRRCLFCPKLLAQPREEMQQQSNASCYFQERLRGRARQSQRFFTPEG